MNKVHDLKPLLNAVISCDQDEIMQFTKEALENNTDPEEIARIISEGIVVVGDKYESKEVFLPDLILAGHGAMKAMILINEEILKKNLTRLTVPPKVIIGTVEGDVHNIGKDTVAAMLMAAGFEVHDLGVNVPASQFLSIAESVGADIVAISALMTTTITEQHKIIKLFNEKGKRNRYKILIGGGAVTEAWANRIGADGYGDNAGEAVKVAKQLITA